MTLVKEQHIIGYFNGITEVWMGLKRKVGSRGQSKLTDEKFQELDEIIQKENLQTARAVYYKIKEEFNVEYSI